MNWKIFISTFLLIFLAELGDKTQIAVMLQSAVHGRSTVFIAASLALVLSTLLGVFLGGVLSRLVSERVIHGVGGALFIVFGIAMLYTVFKPGPDIAPVIQAAEPVSPAEQPPKN